MTTLVAPSPSPTTTAPVASLIVPDPDGRWAEALIAPWRDLAEAAVEPNAFFGPDLLLPALRHLAEGRDVRIFALWEGMPETSRLLALVPVAPQRSFGRLRAPNVATWLHPHAFLGTPLVRPGHEAAFWAAFVPLVARTWWGGLIQIRRIDRDGPLARALDHVDLPAPPMILREADRAFLTVPPEAEPYLEAQLRGKKRKELRRQRRRLGELGELTFTAFTSRPDIDAWIADFLRLEAAGWKGRGQTAIAQQEAERRYFSEALRAAADHDRLLAVDCRLDGRPIAMHINLRAGTGCFSFKTCFDEDFSAYSPGVQVQLDNIDALIAEGIAWSDSCAAKDHPMINSIWRDRIRIADIAIGLDGPLRRTYFLGIKSAEFFYRACVKR